MVREYYFNDHGAQIDRFTNSLIAAAKGEPTPEDGYAGTYIGDIAAQVLAKDPDALSLPDAEMRETFRAIGVNLMFDHIKESLHEFGTDFDVYTHEDSMHTSGRVEQAIAKLRDTGSIYEKDGAVWLRTTDFGDDKDRVVIKSDGQPAYIAGDLAYFLDKRQRGFDLCIYMLGADHHGYIARLKAAAAALGDDPDTVEVLIGQMVNLVRDGQPVRMSKRAGTVITLDDLVEAIGVDAARYALARASVDQQIDLDIELWTKKDTKEYESGKVYLLKKELDELWAANKQSEALAKARHDETLAAVRVGTEEVVKKVETEGEKNRMILSNQITKADRERAAEQRAKDAIVDQLRMVTSGGGTDLYLALQEAYAVMVEQERIMLWDWMMLIL